MFLKPRIRVILGLPALAPILGACVSEAAPSGQGLCWRQAEVSDQQPRFELIARDVPNLESCAVQLEGARMLEGRSITGAYSGYFIFATEQQITSAKRIDGAQIRVFEAADRSRIQDGLRELVEYEKAQPSPGE
jgi:hypothetical protein